MIIHIAGPDVTVGHHLRQRCAWCGATLADYDLTRVMVPVGTDPRPATWPPHDLVAIDGNMSYTVEHVDGADLPAEACALIDPDVTR